MCGFAFRRVRLALLCLAVAGLFVATVPPFDDSISSALNRNDSSALGHVEAIGRDVDAFLKNIVGLGLGSADQTVVIAPPSSGQTTTTPAGNGANDVSGIGENLYLSVLVSTGPLGGLTFCAWCVGLIAILFRGARKSPQKWLLIGSATAFVGSLVSAMTSSALMRFTTAASSWLLLGLATGLVLATSPELASFSKADFRVPSWLSRRIRIGSGARNA
jgi:hypothetical protein